MLRTVLGPWGYTGKNDYYTRVNDDQIHRIDLQRSATGYGYFLNLGWHYRFMPGLFSGEMSPDPVGLHLLDFIFHSRLWVEYAPGKKETRIPYGQNTTENVEQLTRHLHAAHKLFLKEKTLANPELLVAKIPPKMIADRVTRVATTDDFDELGIPDKLELILGSWDTTMFSLACLLFVLARKKTKGDSKPQEYGLLAERYCRTESDIKVLTAVRVSS